MSLLIYAENSGPRLQYVCQFIFRQQLNTAYSITTHKESFDAHEDPKISYTKETDPGCCFHIVPHTLINETGIQEQAIDCFDHEETPAFFRNTTGDFPFDIFSACFYLLSRYEEYLPHEKDLYGRYAHTNSLACSKEFLTRPVINYWVQSFAKALKNKFPGLVFNFPAFSFLPTYDIDMAYSHKAKGFLRNLGGFIKEPSIKRIKVLLRLEKDEFDAYDFLDEMHKKKNLDPIYFFLVSTRRNDYDKNLSPFSHTMWQLIKNHAKQYRIGLHPSWRSQGKTEFIKREKKILETAADKQVTDSRQHYIQFNLPGTFQSLIDAGITDDYSMGYGSINGFRASTASSFLWYNLAEEKTTSLWLHPFCYMDANSHYEQKLTPEESKKELMYYLEECKKINGRLITIFHNNFLGTAKGFEEWKNLYDEFISQVQQ